MGKKVYNVTIYNSAGESKTLRGVTEETMGDALRGLRQHAQDNGWVRPWFETKKEVAG